MSDNSRGPKGSRDTSAECYIRASADRVRAEGMDTTNGRRKFEQSAATWDVRGELLGRLEASVNKRERLDAESVRVSADHPSEWPDAGPGAEAQ